VVIADYISRPLYLHLTTPIQRAHVHFHLVHLS
jgi:hypothetical protein